MTEEELKDMLKARDMLDAQPVPELSPESLYNIMEAMGFAQHPWVGLTDEDRLRVLQFIDPKTVRLPLGFKKFAEAIEQLLKEKNT
jgi:hypothetical protein